MMKKMDSRLRGNDKKGCGNDKMGRGNDRKETALAMIEKILFLLMICYLS
jgi:hypothetical protein